MIGRIVDGLLVVVLLAALVFFYENSQELRRLREAPPVPVVGQPDQPPLPVGDSVPALIGLAEDGGIDVFIPGSSDGRMTFAFAFRTDCPFCEATAPVWADFARERPDSVRFVAISVQGRQPAAAWLERHGIVVDQLVAVSSPQDVAIGWGLDVVPTNYVVNQAGVLVGARRGQLIEGALDGDRWALR